MSIVNAHDFDHEVRPDERQHVLSPDCWCLPTIEHVERSDEEVASIAEQRAREEHLPIPQDDR